MKSIFMVVAILFSAETGEMYIRTPVFIFNSKDECMGNFVSVNYYGLGNGLMNKLQEEQSSDT